MFFQETILKIENIEDIEQLIINYGKEGLLNQFMNYNEDEVFIEHAVDVLKYYNDEITNDIDSIQFFLETKNILPSEIKKENNKIDELNNLKNILTVIIDNLEIKENSISFDM